MTADSDPYELLAVPRSATQDQIRRAYKKACLRYHPDKHPSGDARVAAEGRFKAISRAYSQLCELKTHVESTRRSAPPRGKSSNAFRFDPFFDFFSASAFDEPMPDKELDLPLTLEEFYNGCVKKRRLKNTPDSPVMNISVKPGYRPGDRIRFKHVGSNRGDVVFVLSQKTHDRFHAEGDDLKITMRINLVDALAGAVLIMKGLDGSDVKVRIDCVIHPDYVHKIPGAGMPRRGCPTERGDLHVSFVVIFPKQVEADDRSAVRDLFAKLDAHSRNRMAMRRSSSLFTSRGSAATFMYQRRASTGPIVQEPEVSEDDFGIDRRAKGRRRFTSIFR